MGSPAMPSRGGARPTQFLELTRSLLELRLGASVPQQDMVGIAQLVEHLVVVQDVAGSSPVTHPEES